MNANDSVSYDSSDGLFHAADDSGFETFEEAVYYNQFTLGLPSSEENSGSLPPAIADTSTYSVANGIAGPVNGGLTRDDSAPGSTPDGWNFLSQLATTTMQTAGAVIGAKLQSQITVANAKAQAEIDRANVQSRAATSPAPAKLSSSGGLLLGGILLAAGLGVMLSRRNRRS